MPHYRVLVRGSNFWLAAEHPTKVGFYVTRFVHAPDKASARRTALERVEREIEMRKLTSAPDDPATVAVDELEEVERGDAPAKPSGFAFYRDEAEEVA